MCGSRYISCVIFFWGGGGDLLKKSGRAPGLVDGKKGRLSLLGANVSRDRLPGFSSASVCMELSTKVGMSCESCEKDKIVLTRP